MAASIKKVVVVGPLQSGKSCISNFLSEYSTKPPSATYMPTVGCRILEFEKEVRDGKARKKHSFEIWDVSGNRAYESGWPAIWRDCLGLVIVYNPDRTEEEDLVEWHTWFAKAAGLKDSQVLILAHSPDRPPEKKPLPKALSKIQCTASSLGPSNSEVIDSDTSPLVAAFESLLAGVVVASAEKREDRKSVV